MSPDPSAPITPRGLATQAALVRAARGVFERDGFLDARIADIAKEAGSATGSFYSYFQSKEAIFGAVVDALNEEMHNPPSLEVLLGQAEGLVARVAESHRGFLRAYKRNVDLMRVIDEVTNISDDFRRRRAADAQPIMRSNTKVVRQLQAEGRADADLDPATAGRTLSVIVSRSAYVAFVLDEERSFAKLAKTLTRIWINSLQVPVAAAELAALDS
ncbi:MAG: TetR family transcriptional regulator [Solirubrobacterales bacterium]